MAGFLNYMADNNGGFASGSINLGGLEVYQISTFTKVWASLEGGPGNLGATFFEPSSIPDGYFMLGCYSQPNNQSLFGWVLVGKDNNGSSTEPTSKGTLALPMDYTLVWSSENSKLKKDGNGYIWLPVPPEGYSAVGHIVTRSPEKPPLDKIRCVRSELTDSCERTSLIWGGGGINVYGLRPTIRGTQALGVPVGTFIAEVDGAQSSAALTLSCLKNRDSNLFCMPNMNQIQALVQTYSPWIYLHPDEEYLPASVSWYFNNGALLYKQGDESNPVSIDSTGSNLPQGGSNDGTYWLDLPIDKDSKEKVKRGDLQSSESYLHVKPMLGATFTDIALWVFYPFNGPGKAKVELIDIPLGKTGQHIGDWEHVTLRISNFSGKLWSVYFSEHSNGAWVNSSELEFQGGNKVVAYASLNGHAFYPKPGLVLQGNASLGVGIRNDTAKSKIMMNMGERYVVVSAEHLGMVVVEPPWLNYTRKWGPKIEYDFGDEMKKIEEVLPGKLKDVFQKVMNGLPRELFGEDGPTGPKMKKSWSGDEV
ncbi:Vacuolar protein sorting-associated protein 62 [Macleaya cordata]|uniref:Vacuolar protein sorting-associated protein 62 n=1 Tax=Macleaya cordata TaxID=56857 RepID=A0A200Q7J9_MACCD|nr:Vacuolar protein sorting-associated protein 62 [Macleaya cordata]